MYTRTHFQIQVEIEQSNEGPIPHVHVYHDKTRNPKKCSYVRLDKAEYSSHHDVLKLPKNLKQQFIECMHQTWEGRALTLKDRAMRYATGYEAAVAIWVESYEDDYSKFNLDENGVPIMPDYSQL